MLLYRRATSEFKQAKQQAARFLRSKIQPSNLNILERRVETANLLSQIKRFVHVKVGLDSVTEVEVVARNLDDLGKAEKCDIYGDLMVGLSSDDLELLLKSDPLKRFVPKTG